MKVSKIIIRNIMGIEDLEIHPGALTVVSGANGVGKTSVLQAIRDTVSGGHDPSLIRQGAEEGWVAITLEDGVSITKVIRPDKSTLTVRHPQLGKISKSQQWINAIVDSLSLDPIAFLTAPAKDRVKILLEALPLHVTADQLGFLPAEVLKGKDLEGHALEVLGQIGRELYDERTGINRASKEKRATAAQMSATLLPEPPEGGWLTEYRVRTDLFGRAQRETTARVQAIKLNAEHAKQAARQIFQATKDQEDEELQRQIDVLRKSRANMLAASECVRDRDLAAADYHRDEALRAAQAEWTPINQQWQESIAEAKAKAEIAQKNEAAREFVGQLEGEAEALEEQSDTLTSQIGRIDVIEADLLKSLPIPDLEIKDGRVYVASIPFDKLNDAEKYRLVIEIARLRAGELGLVLLDRAEVFDAAHWQAFQEAARAAGVQIIAGRRTEGPLVIQSAKATEITLDEGADELINGAF